MSSLSTKTFVITVYTHKPNQPFTTHEVNATDISVQGDVIVLKDGELGIAAFPAKDVLHILSKKGL